MTQENTYDVTRFGYSPASTFRMDKHIAEIIKVGILTKVDSGIAESNIELSSFTDMLAGNMVYELSVKMAAVCNEVTSEEVEEDQPVREIRFIDKSAEYPTTLWDHFKMKFFPFLKRNMTSVPCQETVSIFKTTVKRTNVKITKLCPHINLPQQRHFAFLVKGE